MGFAPTGPSGGISFGTSVGPYAGQSFDLANMPTDFFSSQSTSKSNSSGGGSNVAPIAAPNLTPFTYNADSQSYPTYMRNLGENASQQAFQRATNRIGAGNSQQNLMHAQDALNQSRLNYMAQSGQQELGVQNSLADNWAKYNALLAQLYGTQVQQRGQDVAADASKYSSDNMLAARGGGVISLGGRGSTTSTPQSNGSYQSLQGTLNGDMPTSARNYYDRGYF